MLKLCAKRAKITKPVNSHHLRHSAATRLSCHLTSAQMNNYLGWTQGSNMPNIYIHLSGKDIDSAILAFNGIEEKKDESNEFAPKSCPNCKYNQSPPDASFCGRCAAPLDEKTKLELEGINENEIVDKYILKNEKNNENVTKNN